MKKIVPFIFIVIVFYYLIWCFVLGSFNIMKEESDTRGVMVMFFLPVAFIMIIIIGENKSYFIPTREEKIQGIKKYTGELKEELQLYAEANELEAKAKELRKKHGL